MLAFHARGKHDVLVVAVEDLSEREFEPNPDPSNRQVYNARDGSSGEGGRVEEDDATLRQTLRPASGKGYGDTSYSLATRITAQHKFFLRTAPMEGHPTERNHCDVQ